MTGLWAQGDSERMMWLMVDERESPESSTVVDRAEGFGERLLGSLLDRAHRMPPHMIAPLIEQEIPIIGGRDVEVLLQDYGQMTLVPLPGERLLKAPRGRAHQPHDPAGRLRRGDVAGHSEIARAG